MNDGTLNPCRFAVERYKVIAKWRNLWTILLFVFGASVIVFLSLAVLLFMNRGWLPGAVSTLGTIVNGAAVKWVFERRNDAKHEEEEAYADVKKICGATTGVSASSPGVEIAAVPETESLAEIEGYRKKLRLFSRIY